MGYVVGMGAASEGAVSRLIVYDQVSDWSRIICVYSTNDQGRHGVQSVDQVGFVDASMVCDLIQHSNHQILPEPHKRLIDRLSGRSVKLFALEG